MAEGELEWAVLGGERVELHPQEPRYARDAFELLHGSEPILRWLVWEGPASVEALEAVFRRWIVPLEHGSDYGFVIRERERGTVLGAISARFAGHPGTGDVGYWLGEPYWGRGYGTEAVRLIDAFAFRHARAEALCASVFVGNEGSRRVLERNGYSLVRTAPRQVEKRGRRLDEWTFTLLRSDWARRDGAWTPRREEVSREGGEPPGPLPGGVPRSGREGRRRGP